MPSTYLSLHYHLVFGTKNREATISPEWRARLHYAAFTVSATSRDAVRHYIANQEEHHRVKSFREEVVEMLNKAGIEYDPQYLD